MTKFYLGPHKEQRRTGPMSTTNCAAASGAMLANQATLGIKNPTVQWFRKQTGDDKGGLMMHQVAAVLDEMGIDVHLYDYRDNLKWARLRQMISRGAFAIVAGDYDVIPDEFRGADYDGFHAVMYHQRFDKNQRTGDPLLKGWVKWPNWLAAKYVKKFDAQTQGGIHAVVMVQHFAYLRTEVEKAVIRAEPDNASAKIGTMTTGTRLITGGTVKGEAVAGVNRWRKVWVPGKDSVGYVHWTVAWVK